MEIFLQGVYIFVNDRSSPLQSLITAIMSIAIIIFYPSMCRYILSRIVITTNGSEPSRKKVCCSRFLNHRVESHLYITTRSGSHNLIKAEIEYYLHLIIPCNCEISDCMADNFRGVLTFIVFVVEIWNSAGIILSDFTQKLYCVPPKITHHAVLISVTARAVIYTLRLAIGTKAQLLSIHKS